MKKFFAVLITVAALLASVNVSANEDAVKAAITGMMNKCATLDFAGALSHLTKDYQVIDADGTTKSYKEIAAEGMQYDKFIKPFLAMKKQLEATDDLLTLMEMFEKVSGHKTSAQDKEALKKLSAEQQKALVAKIKQDLNKAFAQLDEGIAAGKKFRDSAQFVSVKIEGDNATAVYTVVKTFIKGQQKLTNTTTLIKQNGKWLINKEVWTVEK